MRTTLAAALGLSLALGAGGCGGGGAAPPTTQGPQVVGQVLSRQGQPTLLQGIEVECLNDGVTVTTGPDGSFTLDVPGGVVVRVRFTDPLNGVETLPFPLPPCGEWDDASPDAGDLDDDVVELPPLGDGDVCVLEVELAGGRVIECGVAPPGAGNGVPGFYGEGVLLPLDPTALCAVGEVEVERDGDCASLEFEAAGLAPGATYGVTLLAPDLAEAVVGALVADGAGVAHLSVAGCSGDPLPFGVASLVDLAGYGVLVTDADGVPVLAGQVPGSGHEYGEPGYGGGGGAGGGGGVPGLPPVPPDFGNLPPPPGDYEDLLDLINSLLGAGGTSLPGFPGFGG
jgi:hypothetical protein